MSDDGSYQSRSFPWLEAIGLCIALLLIFAAMGAGASAGGGNVTIASHNTVRVLSPDTTVIINSNNAPTTATGNGNTIISSTGQTLCADPARPGQYNAAACGGNP